MKRISDFEDSRMDMKNMAAFDYFNDPASGKPRLYYYDPKYGPLKPIPCDEGRGMTDQLQYTGLEFVESVGLL